MLLMHVYAHLYITVGRPSCTARSARAPKGYSQLGVPDKDVVDNRYHLISKENN
jgi:hypothetical protein